MLSIPVDFPFFRLRIVCSTSDLKIGKFSSTHAPRLSLSIFSSGYIVYLYSSLHYAVHLLAISESSVKILSFQLSTKILFTKAWIYIILY